MALILTAASDDDGRRLDRILRKALEDLPLSAIYRLLRKGAVLVDGKTAPAELRIRKGQTISIDRTAVETEPKARRQGISRGLKGKPEILFEGAGLLILNKPAGLTVHGRESLEDQVLAWLEGKREPSLSFRPGPLHRLDKPSSGIIVFSTNLEGARLFSAMMRKRMIKKQYLCIIEGLIEKTEIWQDELFRDKTLKKTFTISADCQDKSPGKTALTKVTPLMGNAIATLILAEIETGRTHQIRAQTASRGHPLLGDIKYAQKTHARRRACSFDNGNMACPQEKVPPSEIWPGGAQKTHARRRACSSSERSEKNGFFLHAWRMEFLAPLQGPCAGLPHLIEAPLPEKFQRKAAELFGEDSLRLFD